MSQPEVDSVSPRVLAVIPTYNAGSKLANSLISVLNQDYKQMDTVVIDDCSDIEPEPPCELSEEYTLITNPSNLGFAGTLNRGLEIASEYDYLLVVQDDVELLDRSYVRRATEHLNDNRVAVVTGCAIVDTPRLIHQAIARVSYLDYAPPSSCFISYSVLKADLIRVSALKTIGGFKYSGNRRLGLEDQRLGHHLNQLGYLVLMDPSLKYSVEYFREEGLLNLLRKESIYASTIGYAVIRREISTRATSPWDTLRISHRVSQVLGFAVLIATVILGVLLASPVIAPIFVACLYFFFMVRTKVKSRMERLFFPAVALLSSIVFGPFFMIGAAKGALRKILSIKHQNSPHQLLRDT